jgi:hypothetical protein
MKQYEELKVQAQIKERTKDGMTKDKKKGLQQKTVNA